MRSKPILLSIFFSSIILSLSLINVDTQSILPMKSTFNALTTDAKKQVTCLAENIYFEAAHEPNEGKKAVAFVTFNRVQSGYADDICGVVKQKTGNTCQFSWYCEAGPKVVKSNKHFEESELVARKVLLENFRLPSLTNAMYYHADYVSPNWNLPKITKIGRHIFYGERT